MSYSEADQRADTAFLVGVTHGRETALAPIRAEWERWARHRDTLNEDGRELLDQIGAALRNVGTNVNSGPVE